MIHKAEGRAKNILYPSICVFIGPYIRNIVIAKDWYKTTSRKQILAIILGNSFSWNNPTAMVIRKIAPTI